MIRVLIGDETERGRRDLIPYLTDAEGIVVVGRARDGAEALALARALRPDVLLLSALAGEAGLEVTRQVVAEGVASVVLLFVPSADGSRARRALADGAADVLPDDISYDHLLQAIRLAVQGKPAQPPDTQTTPEDPFRDLTDREREVLTLVAEGYSNKEIAARIGLTVGTVKGYVSSILTKLGVVDRTQAAVFALRHGLVISEG
jgi:NarL family two-component system response regulator LiaR